MARSRIRDLAAVCAAGVAAQSMRGAEQCGAERLPTLLASTRSSLSYASRPGTYFAWRHRSTTSVSAARIARTQSAVWGSLATPSRNLPTTTRFGSYWYSDARILLPFGAAVRASVAFFGCAPGATLHPWYGCMRTCDSAAKACVWTSKFCAAAVSKRSSRGCCLVGSSGSGTSPKSAVSGDALPAPYPASRSRASWNLAFSSNPDTWSQCAAQHRKQHSTTGYGVRKGTEARRHSRA
mmetsp:Transcript_18550/g.74061  ORF Transcript_18550/g.74061 Transcript_18550/m.74061 type:complete len:238 (-) Transcript_18550:177-890(-)